MKLLIVAATKQEIAPLLNQLNATDELRTVSYNKHDISFLVTGIGMVATTYYLCKALRNSYDAVINVGICGSFNDNLELGEVVNIIEDQFSELGVEDDEQFIPFKEIGMDTDTWVSNTTKHESKVLDKVPKVTAITVNTVHGNEASITKVYNKFHPYVESMEGAAFMYVCAQENVPYVQLRAVSNKVEKRNKANWKIDLAIVNCNPKVIEILDDFNG